MQFVLLFYYIKPFFYLCRPFFSNMMNNLKEYNIQFVGLKLGNHEFEYKIGKEFFKNFNDDVSLIGNSNVDVKLLLEKSNTMLVLYFSINGKIEVECDLCLDPIDVEINNDFRQIVKFSDDELESYDDEITLLPSSEHELNVGRYIYEFIHLCIPAKKTHASGKCNADVKNIVDEYLMVEEPESQSEQENIDPRWAALKELKNKN